MKTRLFDWLLQLRASYWFVPSLMAFGAMCAAAGFVYVDTRLSNTWFQHFDWIYASQPEGARALLSTVAGSMITVAGVTFSMTLLVLSHASAQIGPRLLDGFMRDRGNQFTLGTFIATFLYCLMVLRTIQTKSDAVADTATATFVPHLAVNIGVVFAILSVAVLIYFIHHVPQSISIANVVARVGNELSDSIEQLRTDLNGDSHEPRGATLPDDFQEASRCLTVQDDGGYLRVLDADNLLKVMTECDLVAELCQRPGDFAIPGQPLIRVWPESRLDEETIDKIAGSFSWGVERTREQDVLFPAQQLMEVLGKAMSPGVNGQYTALLCIDQLERALAEMLAGEEPRARQLDEDGRLRLILKPVTHRVFVDGVFHPLRQFIYGDWIATNHVLTMLGRLAAMPELAANAHLLERQSQLIGDDIDDSNLPGSAKQALKQVVELSSPRSRTADA